MSSIERSLLPHIGNKDYTNIIFKSRDNNIIRRHLESLDDIYIDWNINKIDLTVISSLLPSLSSSVRLKLYRHLTKKKLILTLVSLDFKYLWEYLNEVNNLSILKDIIVVLETLRYKDLHKLISNKFRVYMYVLEETGNSLLNKYLIDYLPNNLLLNEGLYLKPKILTKIIMNSNLKRCRKLSSNFPMKLILEKIRGDDGFNVNFLLLFSTLGRIEYCRTYLNYIVHFTFEEMKKLVPLIYPCFIIDFSKCKNVSYTLYLNLVEYMTPEQISFVLESSNIELYLDIFNRLSKEQLLYGCKRINEEKFWISLKSVSFAKLNYFITGTKFSHKSIFINKILEFMDLGKQVKTLVPQYQVMCFTYRETFEYIINSWTEIEPYLDTIIFKLLDGKKILILCDYCTLSEWSHLITFMSEIQINDFILALEKLELLERDGTNTCNIMHFCRVYEKFNILSHIFGILSDN